MYAGEQVAVMESVVVLIPRSSVRLIQQNPNWISEVGPPDTVGDLKLIAHVKANLMMPDLYDPTLQDVVSACIEVRTYYTIGPIVHLYRTASSFQPKNDIVLVIQTLSS